VIGASERKKMLAARLCGPRVVARLESIGVERLADLTGRDPWDVMHEVNVRAGRTIWRPPLAILALQNLIDAAERDDRDAVRPPPNGSLPPTS
jgi:hypothetical protein